MHQQKRTEFPLEKLILRLRNREYNEALLVRLGWEFHKGAYCNEESKLEIVYDTSQELRYVIINGKITSPSKTINHNK